MKPFLIEPSPHRAGFYRCTFNGGNQQLLTAIRNIVGSLFTDRVWMVPFDRLAHVAEAATGLGFDVHGFPQDIGNRLEPAPLKGSWAQGLYPFQMKGAARLVEQRRLMVNFKPGLGKTATTLTALHSAGVSSALIVCPAIVRDTWAQEFEKWWPKAAHEVQIIETGKEAQKAEAPFVITSYELMAKVKPRAWGAVVLDECHYLKEPKSKRSKEARAILEALWKANKDALVPMLTGTPIANEPLDLHNQVDLLYPNLWDRREAFARRYCNSRDNSYAYSGKEYYGIDSRFAEELEERLSYLSVAATEREIENLLPPIVFQTIRIRPQRAFNIREYLDNFTRRDLHASKGCEAAIRACGVEKVSKVVEMVEEALAGGSTHISVMTHLRVTAQELGDALSGLGVPVAVVTGDDSHKKRHAEIARLAAAPRGIFVGTMHSIGIGINELVAFPDVIYAELDYRPDEVVQSMKRYHRISGKKSVRIRIPVLEGTLEERVAKSVQRKLRDQEMVLDTGTLAQGLNEALDPKLTDEDFFSRVQEAASKMVDRDVYA